MAAATTKITKIAFVFSWLKTRTPCAWARRRFVRHRAYAGPDQIGWLL